MAGKAAPTKVAAKPSAVKKQMAKSVTTAKAAGKVEKPFAKAKEKAKTKGHIVKGTSPASRAKPKAKAGQAAERAPRSREGAKEAKAAAKMTTEEWRALQMGVKEHWPQPHYMAHSGRGSHTNYRDETYEIITRWTAETKIQYRPHAKSPGSKSHIRYEKYSKATSVAEALALGSWPADWCWDYERGFIKVLGPVLDEPMDISKVTDEDALTDVDRAINRWYKRELAKKLGLQLEDLVIGKGSGESLIMRAHRLVAQREAKKALEASQVEGRKVREDEVLTVLKAWAFAKNPNRQNVTPDGQGWVWSDTLGLLRDRIGDIHVTTASNNYPEVVKVMNQYLLDRLPPGMEAFKWTSLNVNCNYAAKLHRDGNNFGPSFIKAFGDFKGGELAYFPEDDRQKDRLEALNEEDAVQMDLKNGLGLFSGNCGHFVRPFQGERYSIVYFTMGCYDKAPDVAKAECRALGMPYPATDEDPFLLLRRPRGYAVGGKVTGDKAETPGRREAAPTWRFFPSADVDVAPAAVGRVVATPPKPATTSKRKASQTAAGASKKGTSSISESATLVTA